MEREYATGELESCPPKASTRLLPNDMKTIPTNQHYVPQFLLREFSKDNKSIKMLLFNHQIEKSRVIGSASIEGQCADKWFYGKDGKWETFFAEQEASWAVALRWAKRYPGENVDDHAYCYPGSRGVEALLNGTHPLHQLRNFVYWQIHRTQAYAGAALAAQRAFGDLAVANGMESQAAIDADMFSGECELVQHSLEGMKDFLCVMLDMKVKLLHTKPNEYFLLSDNPAIVANQLARKSFRPGEGLAAAASGLQMILPISPSVAICAYDPKAYECGAQDSSVVEISKADTRLLNLLQIQQAARAVFIPPGMPIDVNEAARDWKNAAPSRQRYSIEKGSGMLNGRRVEAIEMRRRDDTWPKLLSCFRQRSNVVSEPLIMSGIPTFPVRSRDLIEESHRRDRVRQRHQARRAKTTMVSIVE